MKTNALILTALMAVSLPLHAQEPAPSAGITKAQQAKVVQEITRFYRNLSPQDRELALPLLANIADNQLPYTDTERGVRLNAVSAAPGQVLKAQMAFLPNGPLASIDREVAQTMLAPLAAKLACTDDMLKPILDLGIRIQVDIADARGQHLTQARMDSSACNAKSLEETLDDLGVE